MPVARRVLGEDDITMLRMRMNYGRALYKDPAATLDELREAVTTLEELAPTARRILGSEHPTAKTIEHHQQKSRAALHAHKASSKTTN